MIGNTMKIKMLHWQEECLKSWEENGFRGIADVVTGAGKTILALGAAEMLLNQSGQPPVKIKIVVPKTFLLYQWQKALNEYLELPPEEIGFYFGGHKTGRACTVMIYVINSARYALARHIVQDIGEGNRVFLIADECHHYGSEENARIFHFAEYLSPDAPIFTLGLSATPAGRNYEEILVPALGAEIYRFSFLNALKDDIISRFAVFNICLDFRREEAAEYEELSVAISMALFQLQKRCPFLYTVPGREFYPALEWLAAGTDKGIAKLAKRVLSLTLLRKELVYLARSRISCVVHLVNVLPQNRRIIIFSERIETAEEIYRRLTQLSPGEAGIYHSKLPKELRRNTLRRFENREIRILVSCKTLDEGLNIPEADAGIIVSSTGSRRQRIQRLGRVLRKKSHDRMVCLYYLFIRDSSEEEGLLAEMTGNHIDGQANIVNIRYDEDAGNFSASDYQQMVTQVLADLLQKGHDEELCAEFMRNADVGLLGGDWLQNEQYCLDKIKSARLKEEKNYYITMLWLIRKLA